MEGTDRAEAARRPATTADDTAGQLLGALVSAGFGGLWAVGCGTEIAGTGRSGAVRVAVPVAAVGVVAALLLIGWAVRLRARTRLAERAERAEREQVAPFRTGGPARNGMLHSRGYRIVVLLELLAIVASGPVLGALGLGSYTVFWVATVVGVHFLSFGVMFWRGFHLIGAVMLVGVLGGLLLARVVSPAAGGIAVAAVCALDLLAASAVTTRYARRRERVGTGSSAGSNG